MRISKYIRDNTILMIALVSLSGSYFFSQKTDKPLIFIPKQVSSFNIENQFLDHFNLGQKRLISSLLWIATILESDHEHYKGKDLNSWMFIRFRTISHLEPKFYETYNFGGPYLSIIKDDLAGASYLYKKGLQYYPNDYNLLKNASFHFYYEALDYDQAYIVLKKLSAHPNTPPAMLSSLARIESQNGKLEDAFNILLSSYESLRDKEGFLAKKMREHLYAIKAEIDLTCLNSNSLNCSRKDLNNETYYLVKDKFRARKEWVPFRIRKKNKGDGN